MSSDKIFGRQWKLELSIAGKEKRILRDLKVVFNVTNTLLGDASLASFKIYNIGKETVSYITNTECMIAFYAGFTGTSEANWDVIFQGEITNSYKIRQGNDIVWNVWGRESFSLLNNTYPPSGSVYSTEIEPKKMLEILVANSGLKANITYLGGCEEDYSKVPTLSGYTALDTYAEEFNELTKGYNLGWKVQNGEMSVFSNDLLDPDKLSGDVIDVSAKTGLLTIPIVDYTGVKFTHLLNGKFKPMKVVDVVANTISYNLGDPFYVKDINKDQWRANGKFTIFEVTHRGDTRGDDWDTDIVAFYRTTG